MRGRRKTRRVGTAESKGRKDFKKHGVLIAAKASKTLSVRFQNKETPDDLRRPSLA